MLELKRTILVGLFALPLIGVTAMTGCEEQGPFERSGERADEAVEEAGEELEEAGEEIKERADD